MSTVTQTIALASTRTSVADFIDALVTVYTLVIIAYILFSLVRTAGLRIPYNTVIDAIEKFLRDAAEPYLGFFRRFIPPLGMFDLSPIVAILTLQIVGSLVVNIVAG
jgi:uncharacterized protein YggT (Ycf19 family)